MKRTFITALAGVAWAIYLAMASAQNAPSTAPSTPATTPSTPTTTPSTPSTAPSTPNTAPQTPSTAPQVPSTAPGGNVPNNNVGNGTMQNNAGDGTTIPQNNPGVNSGVNRPPQDRSTWVSPNARNANQPGVRQPQVNNLNNLNRNTLGGPQGLSNSPSFPLTNNIPPWTNGLNPWTNTTPMIWTNGRSPARPGVGWTNGSGQMWVTNQIKRY